VASETKVIISGDSSSAVSAVNKLGRSLSEFEKLASKALAFSGFSFGTAEIVRMADEFGQLSSRLQLATRFSGDYQQVQAALSATANDTRASLSETVALYTKLSPVLSALGKNSQQSVGIIATVNKAIALSGASAEASAAGLLQFGQALGAGRLNGEELNSILENTPGLADAIAEGLGVTRGELKKLGADGKLSADAVVTALEKVSARVNEDFAKMPVSVGQSLQMLNNAMTEIVGGAGQSTGAMGGLARAIVAVTQGIRDFAASIQGSGLVTFVMEAIDGVARLFRIVGAGFGAWAAAGVAALKGNLSEAKEILRLNREDIAAILSEPLQRDKGQKAIVASDNEIARQRLDIAQKLAAKQAELAQKRAIAEGKASADILLDDTKRTDVQIKNAEKLRDMLTGMWEQSLKAAKSAGDEAEKLLAKAADTRTAGADKAAALRRSGLSDEEQQQQITTQYNDLADSANQSALLAKLAASQGRTENAAKLAAQAEKDAARAAKLADQISDPETAARAVEQVAEIQASLLEQQAAAKQQEQARYEEQAKAQRELIGVLDAQITELQTKAANIKVQADITAAESAISGLKMQLDALQDKTVTVTVNQVGNVPATTGDTTTTGYAAGGYTGPGGKYQMAGVVHAGEFVNRQEVVRQPGALAFLNRFNRVGMAALRGYATGGLVTPRTAAPVASATFNFPGMGSYPVSMAPDVMGELQTAFKREALKRGGRR